MVKLEKLVGYRDHEGNTKESKFYSVAQFHFFVRIHLHHDLLSYFLIMQIPGSYHRSSESETLEDRAKKSLELCENYC